MTLLLFIGHKKRQTNTFFNFSRFAICRFCFFLETDYQGEYGDRRPGINQHLIYSEKVMILLFMEIESV
jgi:hypothetical protein